uniref:Uncharacterized protein n=1 Tax=Romanomermis culicivorax TaxID=13658 RepID=A0A915JTX0_ROMCU
MLHKILLSVILLNIIWFSIGVGKSVPKKPDPKSKVPGPKAAGRLVGPSKNAKMLGPSRSAFNSPVNAKKIPSGKIPGPKRPGKLAGPKKGANARGGGQPKASFSDGAGSGGIPGQFNFPGVAGKQPSMNNGAMGKSQFGGKEFAGSPDSFGLDIGGRSGSGDIGSAGNGSSKGVGGQKSGNEVDNFKFQPNIKKNTDGQQPDSLSNKIFNNLPPGVPQLSNDLKKKLTPEQLARIIDAIKAGLSSAITGIIQASLSPIFDPDTLGNISFKDMPQDLENGLLDTIKKFLSTLEKHLQKMIRLMEPSIQKLVDSYLSKGKTSPSDLDELGAKIAIMLTTDAPFMEILTSITVPAMFPESDLLNELTSPDFVAYFSTLGPVGDIKAFLDRGAPKALLDTLNKLLSIISALYGTKLMTNAKPLPHIRSIAETLLFSKIPTELLQNGFLRLPCKQISPYLSPNSLKIPDIVIEFTLDKPVTFIIEKLPQKAAYLPILLNYLALNKDACSKDTIQRLKLVLPDLADLIQNSQKTNTKPLKSPKSFNEMTVDLFKEMPVTKIRHGDVYKRMKSRSVLIAINKGNGREKGDRIKVVIDITDESQNPKSPETRNKNEDDEDTESLMQKAAVQVSQLVEGDRKVVKPSAGQQADTQGYTAPSDEQATVAKPMNPPSKSQQGGVMQRSEMTEGNLDEVNKPSAGEQATAQGYANPIDQQADVQSTPSVDSQPPKAQQGGSIVGQQGDLQLIAAQVQQTSTAAVDQPTDKAQMMPDEQNQQSYASA